jgi:hypothetical protein
VAFETCLRCQSPDRYYLRRADGDNGSPHLTAVTYVQTDVFVCGACGYVERYVKPDYLPRVRERAIRVSEAVADER